MDKQKKQPVSKQRVGQFSLTEWPHEYKRQDGTTIKTTTFSLQKSYKSEKEDWVNQTISGLSFTDLCKLKALIDYGLQVNVIYERGHNNDNPNIM